MPDNNLEKLSQKNLLTSIKAVVGSPLFRHLYVRNKTTGQEIDAVNDGQLSCALMVSSLLALQGLLDRPHATVATTLAKMKEAGWYKIDHPLPGAVVEWPAKEGHEHIGFVVRENLCVSNSVQEKVPVEHSLTLQDGRTPTIYYWHNEFQKD